LRAEVSEFDNDDEVLFWDADVTGAVSNQGLSLAPDSDYYKVAGQLVWRPDMWDSSLAVRASHSQHDNSLDLYKIEAGAGKFDGEVSNTSFDAAFNFTPVGPLDAKVYLKYFERENDGDTVTAVDDPITNSLNEYDTTVIGFDLGYALSANTSIDGGFEYSDTDLDGRSDADGYEDTELYLQWRNRTVESLDLRAKVAYLERDGDPNKENIAVAAGERSYDVSDQERTTVELAAMIMVSDNIDFGIDFAWWDAEYDDTDFNLTDLEHYETYVTVGYYEPDMFTSSLYFGYEYDETDMTSEPSTGLYKEQKEFDTIAYGINVEVPLFDVLVVSALWDHSWVDGEADFNRADLVDFDDVEDYEIKSFELKCDYDFSETIAFTVGYIYEKYEFDDDQWDGYAYLPGDSTLTGAYSDQDFENNIGYFMAKYRF
jgi:hypothetical protein